MSEVDADQELLDQAAKEHARYLGIDPVKHEKFMWIARESMMAPPPEGWQMTKTEDGTPFFHHTESGRSQWEHPEDEKYRQMFQDLLRRESENTK